jgi:hypothetical protein
MNNKDNVISIEDYKKKVLLSGCCDHRQSAPPLTPEQILSLIEASTPLRSRVHVKAPQPKPWYHWYKNRR